jgi:hypothetical protein
MFIMTKINENKKILIVLTDKTPREIMENKLTILINKHIFLFNNTDIYTIKIPNTSRTTIPYIIPYICIMFLISMWMNF